MRYVFGFMCVCALGVMPLVGCSETTGDGGSGGDAGSGGAAGDGGSGGMPECQNPEDCDDGEECTTDTCASGVCENTAIDDGTTCAESNECAVGQCASGACELTPVTNGTACGDDAGTCQVGSCQVACTEQGIRDAIAAGGGPYTFECAGPQTVVTAAEIVIDNDVILDGEGNLTVDGDDDHLVFAVNEGVIAELTGFTVTRGRTEVGPPFFRHFGGCISNEGTLALTNCTVTRCTAAESITPDLSNNGGGIGSQGPLTLTNCIVSENSAEFAGGGIWGGPLTLTDSIVSGNSARSGGGISGGGFTITNSTVSDNVATLLPGGGIQSRGGPSTITNSTVSGNSADTGGGILSEEGGELTIANSTISGNTGGAIHNSSSTVMLRNATVSGGISSGGSGEVSSTVTAATLIDGTCTREGDATWTSLGYNIESPGDTCGFDQTGDQASVSAEELNLGPLQDNGGPTETHKPGDGGFGEGSIAIDVIPVDSCEVAEDQRGQPRPAQRGTLMCDVGSVEVHPARVRGYAFSFALSPWSNVCPGQPISFTAATYGVNYSCRYGLASCQDYSGYTLIFRGGDASGEVEWQGGPYLYPHGDSLADATKYTNYYPSGELTAASTPGYHEFTIRVCGDGMTKCGMQPSQTKYYGVRIPPTLSDPGPQSGAEGQALSFSITSSGPGTWNVTGLPPGASVSGDGDTRTFDWTPSAGQAGNYNVTFTLDNCGALTDTRNVAIIIGEGQ